MKTKEELREYQRLWRQANKDKVKGYDLKQTSKPGAKEKRAEWQREWRKNNPERSKEIDNLSYQNTKQHNRQVRLLSAAKERARKYNLPFDIEKEDIVIPEYCPVLPWIKLERHDHNTRPELDRIIPELGYVKGNVQVISGRANRIKWNASLEELERVATYVRGKAN